MESEIRKAARELVETMQKLADSDMGDEAVVEALTSAFEQFGEAIVTRLLGRSA